MGDVNKLSTTKLEASNENESQVLQSLTDAKLNTNDLATRAGRNLRVIAIRDSTYNDLKGFAFKYESHPTFDTIMQIV
jgi:hypothetical protein